MAGRIVHVEFPVSDTKRGMEFYGGVFDWQFQDSGMPGIDYQMFRTGESDGGAIMQSDNVGKPVIYLDTDDIDASIAKVRQHGGEAEDKEPIPTIGWFARCKDPEGNEFSLYQNDPSAAPPH
jgi:predicted enzyme related to lactoylglutathione lyase